LPALVRLLDELESGVKGSDALDAQSLLLNIGTRFVAMLTLMHYTVDIGKAADLVNTIQQQLNEASSEESHFEIIWIYAQNTC
jgi:hypothetical protein